MGERQGETHQCVTASCAPPIGYLARNPGMCPDWESNQPPFGSTGRRPIHLGTSARALSPFLMLPFHVMYFST